MGKHDASNDAPAGAPPEGRVGPPQPWRTGNLDVTYHLALAALTAAWGIVTLTLALLLILDAVLGGTP